MVGKGLQHYNWVPTSALLVQIRLTGTADKDVKDSVDIEK